MSGQQRPGIEGARVCLEMGTKRVFASALEWPGWCRSARGESEALEALIGYAHRYRDALAVGGVSFEPPAAVTDLAVVARHEGSGATDFGVPSVISDDHERPLEGDEVDRWDAILAAAWVAFDQAVEAGAGHQLRLGPRGGGRSLDAIVEHVGGADVAYLSQLGSRQPRASSGPDGMTRTVRERARRTLKARASDAPLEEPSSVKRRWPPRYYVSRAAWHALDHAWEIEDRIV